MWFDMNILMPQTQIPNENKPLSTVLSVLLDTKVASHKYQHRGSGLGGRKNNLQAVIHLNTACSRTIFKHMVQLSRSGSLCRDVTHLTSTPALGLAANDAAARRPWLGFTCRAVEAFRVV